MISLTKFKRCLILAPHTDDGEFGCGGTIARLIEEGCEVFYVAFSACEQSVLPQFPKDILITEVKEATLRLGIEEKNLTLLKYNVREFNFKRQFILDDLINLKKQINPDLVFMPSVNDIHQDHATITNEGIRAFKFSTIFCYELPWNNFSFNTTCFITLQQKHIDLKVNAIQAYQSQAHRTYSHEEFIKGLARVRGVQAGVEFAETFEIVRLVL